MAELHTADLLIELGCEELPPKALGDLALAFYQQVCDGLRDALIDFDAGASRYYYTPRRMAMVLAAVAVRQPDQRQQRRGPAKSAAFDEAGAPTPAAHGFARSVGLEVGDLEVLSTDKGEWLYCELDIPGKPLKELVFPVLQQALDRLPVPRPMRWADHDFSFVRPVHWLVALHGEEVLAGELYGCRASRATRGHRIHAPGAHEIKTPSDYVDLLRECKVEVDQARRMDRIREAATSAGEALGGQVRITDALLDEVCNLLEWPVAVACRFDEDFLDVPPEALIASMETHQKFFPVLDPEAGALTSGFVAMANLESQDPAAVRAGFERVVRPRLADARFFWNLDLKTPLAGRLTALDEVVYQDKLGTIGDKSRRISNFSAELEEVLTQEKSAASRAALLCKCDLVTEMVGEFPELQGTMGGYYATASGESAVVAAAIASHYQPRFSGDQVPPDDTGRIVGLADRMDTIAGVFAAGLKPSGNKDPFALRRAALGVIRILLEGDYNLPVDRLLDMTARHLEPAIAIDTDTLLEVRQFILERLRHFVRDQGFTTNQVQSALAAPLTTLPDLLSRLRAIVDFMSQPEAESLVLANKRIGNILKKQDGEISKEIDAELFNSPQEIALFDEVLRVKKTVLAHFSAAEYGQALAQLAGLKGPVDEYFDHVMVMHDDPAIRANRLAQLMDLKALFDRVADLSLVD